MEGSQSSDQRWKEKCDESEYNTRRFNAAVDAHVNDARVKVTPGRLHLTCAHRESKLVDEALRNSLRSTRSNSLLSEAHYFLLTDGYESEVVRPFFTLGMISPCFSLPTANYTLRFSRRLVFSGPLSQGTRSNLASSGGKFRWPSVIKMSESLLGFGCRHTAKFLSVSSQTWLIKGLLKFIKKTARVPKTC